MSNDHSDDSNPFAPSRRRGDDLDPAATRQPSPGSPADDDEYHFDYRAEDFDYDPDEILDDEEEPELSAGWPEPDPAAPPPARVGAAHLARRGDAAAETEIPDDPATYRDDEDPDSNPGDDDSDDRYTDDDYAGDDDDSEGNDDEDWDDYEEEEASANPLQSWPLGMIAIAVVALILLAVGGFGIMQERSAMQAQIRELQSQLAVAVDPDTLSTERETQRELVERSEALGNRVQALLLENRRLTDTVNGLEQQLEAQQAAAGQADDGEVASATRPEPDPEPEPDTALESAPADAEGNWFVNFGSYSQRERAESWAQRLEPAAGRVVVSAAPGGDLFRVRVVSLADEKAARAVAAALKDQYDLSELWVGED